MKILFLGSGSDAPALLEWTAEQSGAVINGVIGDKNLEEYAKANSYPTYFVEDVERKIGQEHEWVDLVVSYQYFRILKPPIIGTPRFGCVNFHPAPLPDYRGRAGCSFAILDKLDEWGCTAHYMDEGVDTGDIIEVARFPFDWCKETGLSLKQKTLEVQCELYKKVIAKILHEGRLDGMSQSSKEGRYISTQDMLTAMKISEGDDIDAKIQAFWFPPHEGAYIELPDGRRYTLVNKLILDQCGRFE